MSRKPTLSPTRLTTYLACPLMYRWTFVDDRGKWYLRSKSCFSFGTSLHAVLQRFHDSGDTGVETTDQALAALEESWIQAGYSSQDEMMQALSEGKAIVESYLDGVATLPTTSQTVCVEKKLTMDMGRFDLTGRLDRVDRLADGTLEIIDYKTGRDSVTEQDVANDFAMGCYQLLLREHYPDTKVVASIVALRTQEKATFGFTDEQAQEFKDDLRFLGGLVLDRDYENIDPKPKALCRRCDFLPICRKHADFEFAEN